MKKRKSTRPAKVSEKTPHTYRLSANRIAAARKVLGTSSDTATIEEALDMVVLRKELVDGISAMFGAKIVSPDE